MKKLCRSYHDRKICGVCGGIGEYLGVDPTVVRLVFVVLGLLHVGIILYIGSDSDADGVNGGYATQVKCAAFGEWL